MELIILPAILKCALLSLLGDAVRHGGSRLDQRVVCATQCFVWLAGLPLQIVGTRSDTGDSRIDHVARRCTEQN